MAAVHNESPFGYYLFEGARFLCGSKQDRD